jgi:transposase
MFRAWETRKEYGETSRSCNSGASSPPGCCSRESRRRKWPAASGCIGSRWVAGPDSLPGVDEGRSTKPDVPGRKPRLKAADLRWIERGLKRGPQALGYETNLWTSWRVAHLIESECGVRYHPSQAWRILQQLGWSCQRPVGRALERDETKIRKWKRKRWPEIKKKRENKGVPLSSSTKAD